MKMFYSNGVPGVDKDSPEQPVQGLTLAEFELNSDTGEWTSIQRGPDGEPYFGYKAKELTEEEAAMWKTRILQSAAAGAEGYKDWAGVWFPGRIGRGRSVLDAKGWKLYQKIISENVTAAEAAQFLALKPAYAMAKSVNSKDPCAVLAAFRPDLSPALIAKLHKNNTVI